MQFDIYAPLGSPRAEYSPYYPLPNYVGLQTLAKQWNCSLEDAFARYHAKRNEITRNERKDPLRHGYRPPIWQLCWGLLDVPWQNKNLNANIRERLGFKQRVRVLIVMGDNRGSKTCFEMMTCALLQWTKPKCETWSFQTTNEVSVNTHHKILYQYLPPELRAAGKIIEPVTNISYGQKEGFTKSKYVLPNASEHSFKNYSQGPPSPLESGNPDAIAADEEMQCEWAERAEVRVASTSGFFILAYTPINGYSPTVYTYYHGAKVILDAPAFLLPADGGPPLPWMQLGLSEKEYSSVVQALDNKENPIYPLSRPPELDEILDGGRKEPPGRHFHRMPRVLKTGVNGDKAIVHFHCGDNPFGIPENVIRTAMEMPDDRRKIVCYGYATKTVSNAFPLFDRNIHVVKPSAIPSEGTNWQIVDPSSARPFFMLWRRDTPDGRMFIYREWPGNYAIPGLGFLGPWAEQGGAGKRFDGKKGTAQIPIGWGAARYKEEIARLEGWKLQQQERPEKMGYEEWITSWSEYGPAKEKIYKRFMDARFSAVNNLQSGGVKSLFETFDEVGLTFEPTNLTAATQQSEKQDGLQMINDALCFDPLKPLDFFNHPRLYISEECVNLIFAMTIFTGLDTDAATGDPIDCLRYSEKVACKYVPQRALGGRPGRGCY